MKTRINNKKKDLNATLQKKKSSLLKNSLIKEFDIQKMFDCSNQHNINYNITNNNNNYYSVPLSLINRCECRSKGNPFLDFQKFGFNNLLDEEQSFENKFQSQNITDYSPFKECYYSQNNNNNLNKFNSPNPLNNNIGDVSFDTRYKSPHYNKNNYNNNAFSNNRFSNDTNKVNFFNNHTNSNRFDQSNFDNNQNINPDIINTGSTNFETIKKKNDENINPNINFISEIKTEIVSDDKDDIEMKDMTNNNPNNNCELFSLNKNNENNMVYKDNNYNNKRKIKLKNKGFKQSKDLLSEIYKKRGIVNDVFNVENKGRFLGNNGLVNRVDVNNDLLHSNNNNIGINNQTENIFDNTNSLDLENFNEIEDDLEEDSNESNNDILNENNRINISLPENFFSDNENEDINLNQDNINNNNDNNNNNDENNINNNDENNNSENNNALNYEQIDNKIIKYFKSPKEKKQDNKTHFRSTCYHLIFNDTVEGVNNKKVIKFFEEKPCFNCGYSVCFHKFNEKDIRVYFYIQLTDRMRLNKDDFDFCKIRNYNKSADYIIKILNENKIGKELYDKGPHNNKGGKKRSDIILMDKKELKNLSNYYSRTKNIVNSLYELELSNKQTFKEVKVFYIKASFEDGSTKFLVETFKRNKILYNVISYDRGFWTGIDSKANVAIYENFHYDYLPIKQFEILVSSVYHYFNVKNSSIINMFNYIYLLGSDDPKNIYSDVQGIDFTKRAIILSYDRLKNDPEYEKKLCVPEM